MQWNFIKKCVAWLTVTLFHIPLLADQKAVLTPGYNAPARTKIDQKWAFYGDASFIFWQPLQENMQLGVVSNHLAPLDLVNGHEVPIDAYFRPGFQVGLGMNFDYDDWDSYIEYTWYHAKESVHVSLDPTSTSNVLFPAWQVPSILNPQYSFGSEEWKVTLNIVNWDLARAFYVGKELTFRPFMGFRGAWIGQTLDVDYVNTEASDIAVWPSTDIDMSANSWGIGPRIGVGMNWHCGKGVRVVADGEWDILYTQYHLESSQISNTSSSNRYIIDQHKNDYLRTHVNLDLGLGWGSYFDSNKYHVDLLADYSFQVFFDQNMFRTGFTAQAMGRSILPNGNLYMQGLTVKLRFDF